MLAWLILRKRRACFVAAVIISMPTVAQGPPAAPVWVATAVETELAPTAWVAGTVVGRNDARVAAEVDGRLLWIAEVGTRVKEGETIARLDDTESRLEVSEAKAVAAREKARFKFLQEELQRFRQLVEAVLITRSQLDQARSKRDAGRSEWQAAEARLRQAQNRLAYASLSAPFTGVVTERLRRAGERVARGETVLRLVDPMTLEVRARVGANSLPHLRVGTKIKLQAGPDQATGRVRTIVPVGDDRSHLYDVRIEFDKPEWPAGTTLRVAVPTAAKRMVVAVPRDALVLRRDAVAIFRIGEGDTAERVAVAIGVADGSLIEVGGGIKPGDRVVIRGGERLFPGQKVIVQNAPKAP